MATNTKKFIAYLRVSTRKQKDSGAGIEAQRKAVNDWVAAHGGVCVREFVEVESGTNCARPELQKAYDMAALLGATVIIAKLDRLARSVRFISRILDSNMPTVCPELPDTASPMGRMVWQMAAVMAEVEVGFIRERTSKGMRAKMDKQGMLPGVANPKHRFNRDKEEHRRIAKRNISLARKARQTQAECYAGKVRPLASEMQQQGKTMQEIANTLNSQGIRTRTGGVWSRGTISRLLSQA